MSHKQTPSQTVGPYFGYGLTPSPYGFSYPSISDERLVSDATEGKHIRLVGQVYDGDGNAVTDAMLEIWQANAQGHYNHPADTRGDNSLDPDFSGFGRCGTGAGKEPGYVFETIKPGAPTAGDAPHLNVIVFMRGLLNHVYTRVYFSDEAQANAADPVFNLVEPARRQTLIAQREDTPAGTIYRFDIHMQGDQETVFFDV